MLVGHIEVGRPEGVVEVVIYEHRCTHCRKLWDTEMAGSVCPGCGQMHISKTTALGYRQAEG